MKLPFSSSAMLLLSVLALSACERAAPETERLLLNAIQNACRDSSNEYDCWKLTRIALLNGISEDRIGAARSLAHRGVSLEEEKNLIEKYK